MEKSGNYIEPKPFVVGSEVKQKRKDGRIVSELSPLTGQLVPIKKVLECFFSMPGVFDVVMAYVNLLENETFGIIGNFMQGALWKFKVAKYFVGKLVLPLNFYHDEYEINNPLGSHSGLAKQGGTYFSIPCLPPEHISQLANIFLASLNYALDRKSAVCSTSRNEAIFRHIVLQINDLLRNGIVVKCGGQEHKLYFGFGLLLGDNEGLNSTQDFASATSYCRFCKASPSDIKVDLFEKTELLRCEEDYDEDVSADYKVSGIKLKSVWNEIDGHHIYNNYSVDLLHDIEEGLLKYGMFHVVHHFVNNAQQKVSLEILNDRMRLFNYYDNGITNKPQLISDRDLNTEKRLRRSGSEMHNFTLIFAMLIGDLISTKDEVWQYYLVVRKILSFLYAPQIQTECIDSFSLLVASHHKLYIHLFNDTLKPKFHNLVHYARIMKQSGPLCHLSTIRYEARHKPNKEVAAATTSRRDPLRTVAIKNQLQLCYRLTANQGLRERFHVGPSCAIMPGDKTLLNVLESYGDFVEISWVEINGTKYRPNMFVCHSVDESDGLPQFGQIEKILCNENFEILLHCKNFETLGLEENFSAYEVVVKHGNINVPIKSLIMYSPVVFWKLGLIGDMFMTLRHAL
ncbi:Digeranylgeranylglycerophospholipid reductase [Frankliniella fusca]|uniref:Digeranylgeranylglycerophospholipid reductase n=1 Tax=Frankliniella fusca TaxID=407009 RepID=A0AAE1HTS8_9NEOP|nr:Digeranylgeranylglycerophospholipid reductase [Frankliniella fusca]